MDWVKWFNKYAKNADVVIHECFVPVENLIERMNFPVERALLVGVQVHTSLEAFGRVWSPNFVNKGDSKKYSTIAALTAEVDRIKTNELRRIKRTNNLKLGTMNFLIS